MNLTVYNVVTTSSLVFLASSGVILARATLLCC